jgi:hypothetical protein
MSGDQSEYIRGKEAIRGKTQDVRFMKDGFDEWAESTRPAREGQMEKNPSEEQMTTTGGAMSLKKAKLVAKYLGKTMRRGGNIVDDIMGLVPENIKKQVDAVIQGTKGVLGAYRNISSFIDDFIEEIKDEFIDNPKANAKAKAFAVKIVDAFNKLKTYKDSLDGVAKVLEGVGLGRGGQRRGGDLAATVKTVVDKAKEIFGKLMTWLKFFYDNAVGISQFLKLKTLNRADLPFKGQQILDYIQPIFDVTDKLSGLLASAKKGGRGCQSCECGDSDEEGMIVVKRRGGRTIYGRRGGMMKQEGIMGMDGEEYSPMMKREVIMGMDGQEMQEYSPYMGYSGFGPAVQKREQVYEREVMGEKKSDAERLLEKFMKIPDEKLSVRDREQKQYLMKVVEKEKRYGGRTIYGRRGGYGKSEQQYGVGRKAAGPSYEDEQEYSSGPGYGKSEGVYGVGRKAGGRTTYASSVSSSQGRAGGRRSARGEIVKKVMREQGLSLPQASKYVKDKGLYRP